MGTETLAQNVLPPVELPPQFPPTTQLPESDGSFVKNFQEHPQSLILTRSGRRWNEFTLMGSIRSDRIAAFTGARLIRQRKSGSAGLVLCAKCTPRLKGRSDGLMCYGENLYWSDHRLEFASLMVAESAIRLRSPILKKVGRLDPASGSMSRSCRFPTTASFSSTAAHWRCIS